VKTSISIITCTRNSSAYLGQLLDSVLEQILQPSEHIFVDSESEDETLDLIARYAELTSCEVVVVKCPPRGISNAMNIGASVATGNFLMHLHSDDMLFDKDSLLAVKTRLELEPVTWLTGECEYIDATGENVGKGPEYAYSRGNLLKRNFISHPSTFISRKVFIDSGGFDESLHYAMDYDLWLRISICEKLTRMPNFVSKFRVHEQGASSGNSREMRKEDLFVRLRYTRGRFNRLKARGVYALIEFLSKHSVIQNSYIRLKKLLNLE
jgi:glycosyltransferase involved in cell wall biosynthesis